MSVLRTSLILALMVLSVPLFVGGACEAASQVDQKITESTDMGLDNMTKARDNSVASQISTGIAADPGLANVKDKLEVTVSHNVVTVTGRVREQKQLDRVREIVENAVSSANVKDFELDIEIDGSIEDLPFEW